MVAHFKSTVFPGLWRIANVTPIHFPHEYRPISISPIISKIFEKLITRNVQILKKILPQIQFGFRKGLGTADTLLLITHDLQASLGSRVESRVVSLDFSSAFGLVNHQDLLFKLKLMGIGGPLFNVFKEFLNNVLLLMEV